MAVHPHQVADVQHVLPVPQGRLFFARWVFVCSMCVDVSLTLRKVVACQHQIVHVPHVLPFAPRQDVDHGRRICICFISSD